MEDMIGMLLCKINKVTAPHRHGQKISEKALDDLSNYQIEFEKIHHEINAHWAREEAKREAKLEVRRKKRLQLKLNKTIDYGAILGKGVVNNSEMEE